MECITSVRATVNELALGVSLTDAEKTNDALIKYARERLNGENAGRVVIYNPDAVAWWLTEKYSSMFESCRNKAGLTQKMRSVMPSVTPVCFGSMYSGVMPSVHGIQKYEKPVLKVETLFDDYVKAGKKAAIVSTVGDSISKIFLERDIDYYIYPSCAHVNSCAKKLIKKNKYDLIVIYNGNYDLNMHHHGPESKRALNALKKNIKTFTGIVDLIEKYMPEDNVLFGFCPDHGCHEIDGKSGSHGLDMDEDMNVVHFYGIKTAR